MGGGQFGQLAAANFPDRAPWQRVENEHHRRHLEPAELARDVVANRTAVDRCCFVGHNSQAHVLAECRMGDREGSRLCHRGMPNGHFFDLRRGDLLATTVDHLLDAAGEKQEPV